MVTTQTCTEQTEASVDGRGAPRARSPTRPHCGPTLGWPRAGWAEESHTVLGASCCSRWPREDKAAMAISTTSDDGVRGGGGAGSAPLLHGAALDTSFRFWMALTGPPQAAGEGHEGLCTGLWLAKTGQTGLVSQGQFCPSQAWLGSLIDGTIMVGICVATVSTDRAVALGHPRGTPCAFMSPWRPTWPFLTSHHPLPLSPSPS